MTNATPGRSKLVFFGTFPLAEEVLNALEVAGLTPQLIVAGKDRLDRKKNVIPSPEKAWALARDIPVLQPEKIDDAFLSELQKDSWDAFVVASYGKILPQALLDIPKFGTINLHPSLLPKLRGPSPIRSAILNDEKEVGVSIMILDDKMDHGPLIGQKEVSVPEWPPKGTELDALLAREGAELLAEVLPRYFSGEITPQEQDHSEATYCKIFLKEEGEIDLKADAYHNLLKIRAFDGWPGTFAFFDRNGEKLRVVIIDAHIENGKLVLETVKPEGKPAMSYKDFLNSGARPL
ncbi:methionyl-tRNA formyltransferase [bacterium]|nr:methionyl-tRNA formyltransferase [bacterium]